MRSGYVSPCCQETGKRKIFHLFVLGEDHFPDLVPVCGYNNKLHSSFKAFLWICWGDL